MLKKEREMNGELPEEEEDGDVLEQLFECIICRRPIMCKATKLIKICGKFSCK